MGTPESPGDQRGPTAHSLQPTAYSLQLGILPLFAALFPFYCLLWGWSTALLHLLFGLTLALMLAAALFFDFDRIPFTCSHIPGRRGMALRAVLYWLAFSVYGYAMAGLEAWLLGRPAFLVGFCLAGFCLFGLVTALRRRLMDPGLELVYEEKEEEFYRLDLTVPRSVMAATMAAEPQPVRLR